MAGRNMRMFLYLFELLWNVFVFGENVSGSSHNLKGMLTYADTIGDTHVSNLGSETQTLPTSDFKVSIFDVFSFAYDRECVSRYEIWPTVYRTTMYVIE